MDEKDLWRFQIKKKLLLFGLLLLIGILIIVLIVLQR